MPSPGVEHGGEAVGVRQRVLGPPPLPPALLSGAAAPTAPSSCTAPSSPAWAPPPAAAHGVLVTSLCWTAGGSRSEHCERGGGQRGARGRGLREGPRWFSGLATQWAGGNGPANSLLAMTSRLRAGRAPGGRTPLLTTHCKITLPSLWVCSFASSRLLPPCGEKQPPCVDAPRGFPFYI